MMRRSWTNSENAALARLFSSSAVRELAHKGYSPLVSRMLCESGLFQWLQGNYTLGEVFDQAFSILRTKDNRNEYIYKNAIAQKVLLGKHSLNTSCMLTEFRAGSCKADVVILNGTSTVYEVKSERDKLDRLEKQLNEYLRIFDRVQVITGANHISALEKNIPIEVGIQVLTDRFQISEYRSWRSNLANISPGHIFECLQRAEYLAILSDCGIAVPKVPNTLVHAAAKELFSSLTPEQAHSGMVRVLKNTRSPIVLREFVHSVPDSLKALAISVPLTNRERFRFLEALDTGLGTVLSWAGEK
ncbi:MAG: sce7726 family protein [Armatimonadota bacterium]